MALRYRTRLTFTISSLLVITIFLLTATFAVSFVFAFWNSQFGIGQLLTMLANRNLQYAASLSGKVADRLEEQMAVSAFLTAELVALAEREEPATREDITQALERVIEDCRNWKGRSLVDVIRISDAEGRVYLSTNDVDLRSPEGNATPMTVLPPGSRPSIEETVSNEGSDEESYTFVGVPRTSKGGVVQVGASRELVSTLLSDFQLQQFAELFMLEESFLRITIVDGGGRLKADVKSSEYQATYDEESMIRNLCGRFLGRLQGDARDDQDRYQIQPVGNNIAVITPLLSSGPEENLALFMLYDTRDEIATIRTTLMYVSVVSLAMIVIGVVSSALLSRGLTRPIVKLSHAAREFGKGNFNHRVHIKRRDEFQGLAQAFNTMAISLQEHVYELQREVRERETLESELRISTEVQAALLPQLPPAIPDFNLVGWSRPAKQVGGDFYDFIKLGDNRLGVAIGDATGKGLSAALLISDCAGVLHTLAPDYSDPGELLKRVNEGFCSRTGATFRFVTLFYLIIDRNAGTITYSSAGHNPPLLLNSAVGKEQWLEADSGFPLGIVRDAEFSQHALQLEENDTIVLYSDGLIEARNARDEFYGEQRLKRVVEKNERGGVEAILEAVKSDVDEHMRGGEATDDITAVVIQYRKSGAPDSTAP